MNYKTSREETRVSNFGILLYHVFVNAILWGTFDHLYESSIKNAGSFFISMGITVAMSVMLVNILILIKRVYLDAKYKQSHNWDDVANGMTGRIIYEEDMGPLSLIIHCIWMLCIIEVCEWIIKNIADLVNIIDTKNKQDEKI